MGGQNPEKVKKHICAGLLAHVDAGKTTLSEGLLYTGGSIRKMGRVDNGDAFLDTYSQERSRGITIFSKQAVLSLENTQITLLDTPGHVDFSAEMERTLQVLDYAILVISGADGVQGHTLTLWRLLARYNIPTFLFVNKMDQNGTDQAALMKELKARLSDGCTDFTDRTTEEFFESAAMCEEGLLDTYLETGEVEYSDIRRLIRLRKLFPCFFGSALKLQGVKEFLDGFDFFTEEKEYPEEFGAKVFKIARDEQGKRLTYMKITGGCLKVRTVLSNAGNGEVSAGTDIWEEKVNQIRIYSGTKYEAINEAPAGTVCAVVGLSMTRPGQGLGREAASEPPLLEPVLTYEVKLPEGTDARTMMPLLRQLEEEEPELHIVWNEELQEIHAQIMGEVQIEILRNLILERFGISVEFGSGSIVYKETIANTVEGVGHFEPLRHYAEVHLLLEPGEPGSGLEFAADCSEDILNKNWQRLILTHLEEKEHRGVLIGAPITDMRITLINGRAHVKHTEGGDFRQATYRAVRQGLMQAQSVLLEPWYQFRLEIPADTVGRAMMDIEKRQGTMDSPMVEGDMAVITGTAPVVTMRDYQTEVVAYSRGQGQLTCTLQGYQPCHNTEEVVWERGYIPEHDLANPPGSVFCTHGAGFTVEWDQVWEYMHLECRLTGNKNETIDQLREMSAPQEEVWLGTDEIDAIIAKTFYANGKDKSLIRKGILGGRRDYGSSKVESAPVTRTWKRTPKKEEYLLVDGYNIIFSWKELKELAEVNVDAAREKLMDILCNYQGIRQCQVIVVFDAYRIQGHKTEILDYHNIHVVFTKEAETADQYIEKFAHENASKYHVIVATSDGLEQIIIRGQGCQLLSAQDLYADIQRASSAIEEKYEDRTAGKRHFLLDSVSEEVAEQLRNLPEEAEVQQ
ncbi:MAG: TetM/TetW/TetO/TetS family tetracycline resistance ribosomal protection protein [Clostridiales bacterium]|nr:TetM/TetW/TetO/TetS family tetracycline resistance ribosomal protection protein [Clostridiales bacterium]